MESHGTVLQSNFSKEQLIKFYVLGSEKLGFNFIKEVAVEYEDSSISSDFIKKLEENNVMTHAQLNKANGYNALKSTKDNARKLYLSPNDYLQIYLGIIKLGNSSFEYQILTNNKLFIGGYGLFS